MTSTEAKAEIAQQHGVEPGEVIIINNEQNLDASFFTNLKAGQKLMAIKIVREQFGLGLREAKEAVDAFQKLVLPS
jgi:ribosomal protein L7/L12